MNTLTITTLQNQTEPGAYEKRRSTIKTCMKAFSGMLLTSTLIMLSTPALSDSTIRYKKPTEEHSRSWKGKTKAHKSKLSRPIVREMPRLKLPIHSVGAKTPQISHLNLWDRVRNGFQLRYIARKKIAEQRNNYLSHPRYLTKSLEKAKPYLYYIVNVLSEYDIPLEIALLPIVESGFDPFAYSPSRAAGLWQFISATGKHYGLTQNPWYDARRDVRASTQAAARYLADLNRMFDGDWLLTLAAYNAGPGTVKRAMMRNRSLGRKVDFWSLRLPRETQAYVPRLLALSDLTRNPRRYRLNLPFIADKPVWTVVNPKTRIDLAKAAQLAGISMEELASLNSGFNRSATPPQGPHQLLIPRKTKWRFERKIAYLRADELFDRTALRENLGRYKAGGKAREKTVKIEHVVRKGDSLWALAERYDLSVKNAARWNNLTLKSVIRPKQRLTFWVNHKQINRQNNAGHFMQTSDQPRLASLGGVKARSAVIRKVRYRVRRGDSLSLIASRFRVQSNDIVRWNSLDHHAYIHPGQRLVLYVDVIRTY